VSGAGGRLAQAQVVSTEAAGAVASTDITVGRLGRLAGGCGGLWVVPLAVARGGPKVPGASGGLEGAPQCLARLQPHQLTAPCPPAPDHQVILPGGERIAVAGGGGGGGSGGGGGRAPYGQQAGEVIDAEYTDIKS
jgi:hypothetical protein